MKNTILYFFLSSYLFFSLPCIGKDVLDINKKKLKLDSEKVKKDFLTLLKDKGNGNLIEYMYYVDKGRDYYAQFMELHKFYKLFDEEIKIIHNNKLKLARFLKNNPNIIDIIPDPVNKLKQKTLPILNTLTHFQSYLAFDICSEYALDSANIIHKKFPHIPSSGMIASLNKQSDMEFLKNMHIKNKCILFLGNTIGSFDEKSREKILKGISEILLSGDYMLVTLDCSQDEKSILDIYQSEYNDLLLLNIIRFFKAYYNLKNLNPDHFKIKYVREKYKERDADYLKTYVYPTQDQHIVFENNTYTMKKGQLYHVATSRKFHSYCVNGWEILYNFKIVNILTTHKRSMYLFVLQKK